jgi:hypothetical protein
LPATLGNHLDQQIGDPPHTVVAAVRIGVRTRDRDRCIERCRLARVEAGGAQFHCPQADGVVPIPCFLIGHGVQTPHC